MSLPNKDGTYKARPLEWGVKTDGTPAFVVKYDLLEWWNGTGWEPSGGDYQITGYHYPVKKDGSINQTTYKAIRESLGWDGAGWQSLNDGDYSQIECQVRLGYEQYNDRQQLKVQFINPIDYDPNFGVGKGDPQAVRSLDSQYGSAFRAMAGTTTPAKPRTAVPRAAPSNGNSNGATAVPALAKPPKLAAWDAFNSKFDADADKPTRERLWKELLSELAKSIPAKDDARLWSEAEWTRAHELIEASYSPEVGLIPF